MKSNFLMLTCLDCGNKDFYISDYLFECEGIEFFSEVYFCKQCGFTICDDDQMNTALSQFREIKKELKNV